jgi:mRNA-degrading endonuclease RelE of RelBE toxin-antitoxin system
VLWKLFWQSDAVDDLIDLIRITAIMAFRRTGEGDVKAPRGRSSELRLRVGDWRVILERDVESPGTVYVSRIHLRRDAYE